MKANKLMKIAIATIIILFAFGIVISTSVSIDATNKQLASYRSEIENLKYLKQTAQFMHKNGEWDSEVAKELFGEYNNPDYDPNYSSDRVPQKITNEYDDVINYIDKCIETRQRLINMSTGTPVALLLLGLGMFMAGGVALATCFLKDKQETQPAEGEDTHKKTARVKKSKRAKASESPAPAATPAPTAPAAPITYLECPACHGRVPVITGQAVITCEQCGEAYQNPYME